ncbi:MAG: M50 family metallopeptidase [Solirubrobacteraceae bacterium]|nr:MAG: hypothetical protein DLM63_00400 [Solirubrobacterales bacterium]
MSYLLAFGGFAALIILHEAGHFVAAKAVGMRVERFALFFPPLIFKRRRGETEYGIGAIPLGGYVKITGMNPRELRPDEIVAHVTGIGDERGVILDVPYRELAARALGRPLTLEVAGATHSARVGSSSPTGRAGDLLLREDASGAVALAEPPGDEVNRLSLRVGDSIRLLVEVPPEVAARAYFRQPVWKRIVVIVAGPAVNLVIAFVLVFGVYAVQGNPVDQTLNRVASLEVGAPAAGSLAPGDRILSVDGSGSDPTAIAKAISSHHCSGQAVPGCRATTPARITVRRRDRLLTFSLAPFYDATAKRTRLGFGFDGRTVYHQVGLAHAASLGIQELWGVTRATADAFSKIFEPSGRKQLNGVVGAYSVIQQEFSFDVGNALRVLAIISLALALFNLFPFLPLDGGHVFWALAEKVRGRAVPVAVMERASVVGFMLVLLLGYVGLSNDIHTLSNGGFHVR